MVEHSTGFNQSRFLPPDNFIRRRKKNLPQNSLLTLEQTPPTPPIHPDKLRQVLRGFSTTHPTKSYLENVMKETWKIFGEVCQTEFPVSSCPFSNTELQSTFQNHRWVFFVPEAFDSKKDSTYPYLQKVSPLILPNIESGGHKFLWNRIKNQTGWVSTEKGLMPPFPPVLRKTVKEQLIEYRRINRSWEPLSLIPYIIGSTLSYYSRGTFLDENFSSILTLENNWLVSAKTHHQKELKIIPGVSDLRREQLSLMIRTAVIK